jgi:hypothetical protein
MLLKRDPTSPATAEEAFQIAIAVAKHQSTRCFELRAALPLAKLYQSTSRPVEAHAVLAPTLEGFAPTPEMTEIARRRRGWSVSRRAASCGELYSRSQLNAGFGTVLPGVGPDSAQLKRPNRGLLRPLNVDSRPRGMIEPCPLSAQSDTEQRAIGL